MRSSNECRRVMSPSSRGFTLIELLTVIAIIAILAALTMTIGPRMIERAKIRRMDSALRQINTALIAYYTDNATYPPAYGYIWQGAKDQMTPPSNPAEEEKFYVLRPYLALMKYHGNEDLYDEFSRSYDTDGDGRLSILEFLPRGGRQPSGQWVLDSGLPRYDGVTPVGDEISRQLQAPKRPFVYIPVNRAQFIRVQKYWINKGYFYAEAWDTSDPDFPQLSFPPPKYDAFVLVGVGPGGNTYGILPDPLGVPAEQANNGRDLYHITALRAYFLATRDLNANGELDFHFEARTQRAEGTMEYTVGGRPCNNDLPPWTQFRRAAGPWIFVSNQ